MVPRTKKTSQFFPQIYRKIPASFFLLFLIFFSLFPSENFEKLKILILQEPQNPRHYLKLAEEYLRANDLKKAQREIFVAENLLKASSFEKENPEILKVKVALEEKIKEPQNISQEIKKWEKILEDFPGYRDAYLQLAKLYYQLYEEDKAKENLARALELDPNFPLTKELEKILGE